MPWFNEEYKWVADSPQEGLRIKYTYRYDKGTMLITSVKTDRHGYKSVYVIDHVLGSGNKEIRYSLTTWKILCKYVISIQHISFEEPSWEV